MLLQQLVNGVMLGSTYALVAIGYTLIFGVLRLLHLAHGEVFMVGAFAGLQLVLLWHIGPFGALIGGLIGSAIVGMLLVASISGDSTRVPRALWTRLGVLSFFNIAA